MLFDLRKDNHLLCSVEVEHSNILLDTLNRFYSALGMETELVHTSDNDISIIFSLVDKKGALLEALQQFQVSQKAQLDS